MRVTAGRQRVSAIGRVAKSGLDIVPAKKNRGGRATIDGYAKINFKPWKRDRDMGKDELFPPDEFLTSLGVWCRTAYAIMLRSRSELIAGYREIGDFRRIDEAMTGLSDTAERLKLVANMVETAYHRMLASGAAAVQGVKFKSVDDKPARSGRKTRKARR